METENDRFKEQEKIHAESLKALDRVLKETPKEELDKIFNEINAINDPNGITIEDYFDGFQYEYRNWWNSLTKSK